MHRRTLLKLIAATPLLASLWPNLDTLARDLPSSKLPRRRVRSIDPNWPTPADWDNLKAQVGGNLEQVHSPLDSYKSDVNSTAGLDLLKQMENPYFIGDQPALTQTCGWVDAWTSAPSSYVVSAHKTGDVVAAVNFAREHNLRLVVKGGGHSYQGTSNAADSLLVWTRAMHDIELHDGFIPQGCKGTHDPQPAVTIGAGAMWMDAYNAVTTVAGRYVQGGGCATVGVAGLIQSGGFGSFSKHYGMAAASLLQAEIVTADGKVHILNEHNEPDLFWATKGGGGSSMGVITKVTLKTHELPKYFGGVSLKVKAASDAAYRRLIERFIAFYNDSIFNPHFGESAKLGPENTLRIGMVFQGLEKQEAEDIWRPFLDWIKATPQDFTIEPGHFIGTMNARNWWDGEWRLKNLPRTVIADPRPGAPAAHVYWKDNQSECNIFMHGYESVWLPKSLLAHDQQKTLAAALFASSRHWAVEMHFNKGLAGAPAEAIEAARNTAMNPAVLESFVLVIIAGGEPAFPGIKGHEPDLKVARRDAHDIANAMKELHKIVPDPGSYVSESNYFERSWQQSFWGANYPRLHSDQDKI